MPERTQLKATFGGLLVGAALIGSDMSGWMLALLLFGVANVLLTAEGTQTIRGVTFVAVLFALLWPPKFFAPVALFAWIVWPPAYVVAWANARRLTRDDMEQLQDPRGGGRARAIVAVIIGAAGLASIVYRVIVYESLEQTAALFVGIPAIIAIVVVLFVSPRSAAGVACKAVTVALLGSLLFLWEGVLCVVMSAPLFYAIAVSIAYVFEELSGARRKPWLSCIAVIGLLPLSLEGVTATTSLDRHEEVTATKIVGASADSVERALYTTPRFGRTLPLYLRAGFPRPVSTHVERTPERMRWIVRMRGGEMKLNGMEPRTGDLVLDLEHRAPGFVRWRVVSDDSHMTHFLSWRDTTVQWQAIDATTTRVALTIRYRRGLDPAWYFGPWQRYAAKLAAEYLIDAVATP